MKGIINGRFSLTANDKIIKDTCFLAKKPIVSSSEIIERRDNLLQSLTIDDYKTNPRQTFNLGYIYSNGTRLKYIENRSTLSISQAYNDNGGLVTSAYEGDTSIDSKLPTS
jgi:hypothetical protein